MQMSNVKPTALEIKQAFIDHGCDIKFYDGWDWKGNAWGSDGGGLYSVVVHHTSTASAVDGNGAPSLYWAVNAYYPYAVANQLVGKDPGTNWCLSANGTYHSGLGGPWSEVGVGVGNVLHWRAWGIEIDDPGVAKTINPYQIEQTARVIAALWDLCGWPEDGSRIVTHGDWTDSGPYLNEKNYGPYRYRKNDTLREYYDQNFWRNEAKKYRIGSELWDGTVPKRSACQKAFEDSTIKNTASWRLACRLYDLGLMKKKPLAKGKQPYPTDAVLAAKKSWGWKSQNGAPSERTWIKLFGKDKP